MLDKNQRVARLVAGLGKLMGVSATDIAIAEQAAHLAKADLGTNMVVEMTSLQGVMGREYALREGIPQEVADAIFEHWLPRNAGDILPSSASGMLLGITDRLDSLVGLFAAGLAPKSTADPYGLRRAALGVIEIMAEKQIDANLMKAINLVAAAQPIPVSDAAKTQVSDFIAGRLRVWLHEQDWAADIISAVLVEQNANPYRALVAVNELDGWVENPNWEYVLDNFARCVRITRAEPQTFSVNPDLLSEPQEQKLYKAYQEALETIDSDGNVGAFWSVFEPIAPTIAEFFDKVLVNAEDTAVRQNRLGLLQAISAMQNGRADLSELAGF
jgi:glycyl-tRNA synthetase